MSRHAESKKFKNIVFNEGTHTGADITRHSAASLRTRPLSTSQCATQHSAITMLKQPISKPYKATVNDMRLQIHPGKSSQSFRQRDKC